VVTTNPTAIKHWVALELRRLRETAGYDRAAAAERIGKATTVIAHIETARNLPAPADLELLLDLYGAPDRVALFREMVKRAKRGKDWWIDFTSVPEHLELYLGLETSAARISSVQLALVPGLFQTRDYARTIYRVTGPPTLDDAAIEARVEWRIARQEILSRSKNAPQIRSILDESTLRRMVGGPAVMREQLVRLAQLSEQPNIEIQILPFGAGAHVAMDSPFTIFEYPSEFTGDPGTVYIENRRQGLYYESSEALQDFHYAFECLQAQAEEPTQSRTFILNLTKEYS
jgi:transcriptional regulator with XRE-family HTH domain